MGLLVYVNAMNVAGKRLSGVIKAVARGREIEVHRDMESLIRRLRQPRSDLSIAVLFAFTREDLEDILSIRDLLRDLRIIILLPDSEEDTVRKGHTLRPRFLTYANGDLEDVGVVLRRMLESEPIWTH